MPAARQRLADEPDLVDKRIADCGPEDLATLIYTSGTTGRPKGVRLVHDNWMYEGKAVAALNILGPDDVQYLWLPMSHVLGKVLSAVQLEFGFSTAVDGDLTKIVENLGVIKPTFMGGAPRIFEKVRAKVTLTAQGARRAEGEDLRLGDRCRHRGLPGPAAEEGAGAAAQGAAGVWPTSWCSAPSGNDSAAGSGSSSPAPPRCPGTSPNGSTPSA